MGVDEIVAAIRAGGLSTRDLVRISYALAELGTNLTSILGQYGEELVADAYGGKRDSSGQKGYDVVTADGEELQVKTFTAGKRPGVIRTFAYDVVTVEITPATGDVESARRYKADDLYTAFSASGRTSTRTSPSEDGTVNLNREVDLDVAGPSALQCRSLT